MARTLKLPRDILAKFLPDHRSIIAFEKMFVDIDDNQETNIDLINNVSLAADGANTNAVLALALLGVMQDLAELGATIPANVDEENEYFGERQEWQQDDVLNGREETPLEQDVLTLNPTGYTLQNNQLGFNGSNFVMGDTMANTCQFVTVFNNSTAAFAIGDVIAMQGIDVQVYTGIGVILGICRDATPTLLSGRVVTSGAIGMDTSAFAIGDQLYVNAAGVLNNASGTPIGIVVSSNQVLVRL